MIRSDATTRRARGAFVRGHYRCPLSITGLFLNDRLVKEFGCRHDGVLVSTTGANEDSLEVRPPLVCQAEHVDLFLASMERALLKVTG